MGNYRFRLSDMIPNAWFYKLKDMSRTRKHSPSTSHHSTKKKPTSTSTTPRKSHLSQTRNSYYISTEQRPNRDENFPEQPRRSSTKRSKRKTVYLPSPRKPVFSTSPVSSVHCSCHASVHGSSDYSGSSYTQSHSTESQDFHELIPSEFECDRLDTIIDLKNEGSTKKVHDHQRHDAFDIISELGLPPILTKPMKFDDPNKAIEFKKLRKSTSSKLEEAKGHRCLSVNIVKEERSIRRTPRNQIATAYVRKSSASSTGIKLRGNSPKLASKKLHQPFVARKSVSRNRGISESFAVVKSSFDPERDFRDSMMEMIVENNIKESKDLEDLLSCYLSLNSREYHDLIVKAFERIWFDMAHIKISDS